MNCTLCQRKLKNPTATGMGKTCQKKFRGLSESKTETAVRVEPLFVRRQPRRSYMVFTSPRQTVVVSESETGERFARCGCSPEGVKCLHIEIVAEIDRARFPQDLAVVEVVAVKENLTAQTVEAEPLMICLNDRQIELTAAIARAEKSNLEVFPDFERDSFVVVNRENGNEYKTNLKAVEGKVLANCEKQGGEPCADFKYRNRICKHLGKTLQDFHCVILARFAAKAEAVKTSMAEVIA